jgi:tripartite-type tricarboxylate transporter receptor subunit TctC
LAVTTRARVTSLPDGPTVAEVLGTDLEHVVWSGLMAPRGTPAPVVQRLWTALKAAQETTEVQTRFASMQLVPFAVDSQALAQHIRSEVPSWQAFFQKSGIPIEE